MRSYKSRDSKSYLLPLVLTFFSFWAGILSVQAQSTGGIDDTYKYAWSENIGWVVFKVPQGNVLVTDTQITGKIWSPAYGWIELQPDQGGVTNTNAGNVGGTAWGENIGWVDFSGASIDSSGFFWGYLTGDIIGRTSLNCANTNSCSVFDFRVKTDWIPEVFRDDYIALQGEPESKAIEKYSWGPDRIRDEFRDHYDAGTTKYTFDDQYKESLEHAIQIDMGVQGRVEEYVRDDGRLGFSHYVSGRLPMDSFKQDANNRIVYRRQPDGRETVEEYFAVAPIDYEDEFDATWREIMIKEGKVNLYDQAREKIFQDIYDPTDTSDQKELPKRSPGVRQYFSREGDDDIQTAIRARRAAIDAERERQERFEELRKEILGPQRYEQYKKRIEELQGSSPTNQLENFMNNLFRFLETNIFQFFK